MTLPRAEFVELSGGRLAYRRWGSQADRPIVFWHALGPATSGAYLAEVAPMLIERLPVQPIALDGPGFGLSPELPREAYGVDRLEGLLRAFMQRLQLSERRPVLMGHSWGGAVAAFAAARMGSTAGGLVLLDSGHVDLQDLPGVDPAIDWDRLLTEARDPARTFAPSSWEEFVREAREDVPNWRPQIEQILRGGVRQDGDRVLPIPSPEARAAARLGMLRRRVSESYAAIRSAATPVLLVLATEPEATGALNRAAAERFCEVVPSTTVVALERARHDLFLDAGPALADAIASWLQASVAPSA